jgi:hypothetical protein
MITPPSEAGVEEVVVIVVLWLRLVIEAIGALVIGLGMVLATLRFLRGQCPCQAPPQLSGSAVMTGRGKKPARQA